MRKRTILLLPLLSVLLPLGAGHADSSSGAATQASQQPTYFWGVRQGCFLDGMVWDALHVRDAAGTVRRLSVPMSEDTKNCFGEDCIKALRAGGCGNLNLSGGVWGGEVTEVPDQGGGSPRFGYGRRFRSAMLSRKPWRSGSQRTSASTMTAWRGL